MVREPEHNLTQVYGSKVFNDAVMRERLPKETYKLLKQTIDLGRPLDTSIAEVVANAMKDWAITQGATHYTHWFQPMTGVTAEKHNSFISPTQDGRVIMEFSGKELVKGESDASSFPSGGLRATFEARGYTAWDCTSPAFVKEGTLYIPTAFCSYNGEALDKKTPLLRSIQALSKQAVRVLHVLDNEDVESVSAMVGPEQEYFLIERDMYIKRKDLLMTGRTLFGAMPTKGQELDDHYYGNITDRVSSFMSDLDNELWKLGVSAKTKHNESAPAQHELAPIYTTSNIACDHNQITMEMMKRIALRHDLVCLLHEKPFTGVNGSGKHNNWSLSTDKGNNIFDPGQTPEDNLQFLLFLSAVLWAADEYADLLRASISSAGNDLRLGANEAPPDVVSIFLGEQLTSILEHIETGKEDDKTFGGVMMIGVKTLPHLPVDTTDRNRTSPLAFTGNKFEFRMLGSSDSIADANTIINTIVAEILSRIADRLEMSTDPESEVKDIIRGILKEHKRIIFNGNNYSEEWREEAKRRGLPMLSSTVDAIEQLRTSKNITLFAKHAVLSPLEVESRYEIQLENYIKTILIEARTMVQMARQEIVPACMKYAGELAEVYNNTALAGFAVGHDKLKKLTADIALGEQRTYILEELVEKLKPMGYTAECARSITNEMIPAMDSLRECCDGLELEIPSSYWPFPTYTDLLFRRK
ncbi:MAG: glutamine synthetase type III [Clostridiales bacterium]|nr:glutamine synthetase type III [Clostridiales bacterium]